jgi:hypothetical protein
VRDCLTKAKGDFELAAVERFKQIAQSIGFDIIGKGILNGVIDESEVVAKGKHDGKFPKWCLNWLRCQ